MSKGSTPRPFSVNADTYSSNFDSIFRKDRTPATEGHPHTEAKAQASFNKVEADNGNGSQPDAQRTRQAEGFA